MFSLRGSLSEFLHCFLHIFCCTVLVLGEVDIAFIDVIAEDEGQNTTFANIVGTFARIGAIKQIDGELKELDSCDQEDPDQDLDESQVADDKDSWIGVIRIPVLEYYNAGGSRSCSILERVKKAMVLGASAIIIMTLNHRVIKKLDLVQMFSRPIVISNSTNTSRIVDALQSGRPKLRGKITYNSSLIEIKLLSTLTLWATCGRPSGWEGVVCLGNPEKTTTEVYSHFIGSSSFFASVLFCLLVFKTHVSQLLHNYWISKKEEMLRQETAEAMSKLKIRKYKRAGLTQRSSGQRCSARERYKKDPEVCAVCLDEFLHNQLVRTLPCGHEFHCDCVDRWLLARRTCPLCKGNIIEWLSRVNAADSSNYREGFNEGSETIQSLEDGQIVRRRNTPDLSHWSSHEVPSSISAPNSCHVTCTKKDIISHHRSVESSRSDNTTQHRQF